MYPAPARTKNVVEALAAEVGSFATRNSDEIDGSNVGALIMTCVFSAEAGVGNFVPRIQKLLLDGTTWVDHFVAAAAVTADGTYTYCIGRGVSGASAGGVTESKEIPVPKTFRVQLTNAGAGDGNEFNTRVELELHP